MTRQTTTGPATAGDLGDLGDRLAEFIQSHVLPNEDEWDRQLRMPESGRWPPPHPLAPPPAAPSFLHSLSPASRHTCAH